MNQQIYERISFDKQIPFIFRKVKAARHRSLSSICFDKEENALNQFNRRFLFRLFHSTLFAHINAWRISLNLFSGERLAAAKIGRFCSWRSSGVNDADPGNIFSHKGKASPRNTNQDIHTKKSHKRSELARRQIMHLYNRYCDTLGYHQKCILKRKKKWNFRVHCCSFEEPSSLLSLAEASTGFITSIVLLYWFSFKLLLCTPVICSVFHPSFLLTKKGRGCRYLSSGKKLSLFSLPVNPAFFVDLFFLGAFVFEVRRVCDSFRFTILRARFSCLLGWGPLRVRIVDI